jgi:hypothetical protein
MTTEWLTDVGNWNAMLAACVCVFFAVLAYRMTRARWMLMMAIGFAIFFIVRIGIVAALPILEPESREITSLVYDLFAVSFFLLWWDMRHFYRTNGHPVDYAVADHAARMVGLAEVAATRAAESASKAAEAAKMAEVIADESRSAAVKANRSTKESQQK